MHSRGSIGAIAASIVLTCAFGASTLAAGNQVLTVKAGYVNLAEVKNSFPESAMFERIKQQAETLLAAAVYEANQEIKEAQKQKKPGDEILKLQAKLQSDIAIRQRAVSELVLSQANITNAAIYNAVAAAAKDKGLDFVVDGTGVFVGGKQLTDNGTDITEVVKKRLFDEMSGKQKPKEPESPSPDAVPPSEAKPAPSTK